MLYDAQSSAESLFAKLKKSNDKYEVKLYMLRLVSRLIGRHRLMMLKEPAVHALDGCGFK